MSPEEAIRRHLVSLPEVIAVLQDRVYVQELPENPVYPAVCYRLVSTAPVTSMDGASGIDQIRLQFDCWAKSYTDAKAAARVLRTALDGFVGVAGAWKSDPGVEFVSVLMESARDEFDDELDIHGVSMDFLLWPLTPG